MGRKFEGTLDGEGRKFALVIGRFNEFVTNRLRDGALADRLAKLRPRSRRRVDEPGQH